MEDSRASWLSGASNSQHREKPWLKQLIAGDHQARQTIKAQERQHQQVSSLKQARDQAIYDRRREEGFNRLHQRQRQPAQPYQYLKQLQEEKASQQRQFDHQYIEQGRKEISQREHQKFMEFYSDEQQARKDFKVGLKSQLANNETARRSSREQEGLQDSQQLNNALADYNIYLRKQTQQKRAEQKELREFLKRQTEQRREKSKFYQKSEQSSYRDAVALSQNLLDKGASPGEDRMRNLDCIERFVNKEMLNERRWLSKSVNSEYNRATISLAH